MDMREAVKNRIIELCAKKKWAYHALATFSGIPPSTLKNILNDSSGNPGIVTIKKLCDGLEISVADFFDTDVFRQLDQEIN